MPKYIGQPCTSCRSVFKEGDEIVVCPECGSPYHKECYKREGKCINVLLHETGSEWKPEAAAVPVLPDQTDRVCPNCGSHNPLEAYFCTSCGASLQGERPAQNPQPYQNTGMPGQSVYGGFRPEMSPFVNVRTVSADADVDGNTVAEYSKYVGSKFYYYVPRFLRFAKNGGNLSFNIPAFFLSPLWFFYRKMPVHGIITLILYIITAIPSAYESFLVLNAASMGQVYQGNSLTVSSGFMIISTLCGLLNWAVSIISGLFGNYFYYKKAKADIDKIKADEPDIEKRSASIGACGGTSAAYVFIALGVTFVISYALMFFFTLAGRG